MANDEIRDNVLSGLRAAAEHNYKAAEKKRAEADKAQAEASEHRARAGYFTAMADRWTRIATAIEHGTFDLDYLLSGDDLGEARRINDAPVLNCPQCGGPGPDHTDCLAARHADQDEQIGREMDEAVESTGHLPGRADAEYFDEAEAEDVRQIRREMAIEAGDFDPADENDGGVF